VEDSEDEEFTSYENSIVEAVLKADGSGMLFKHPFINNKLQPGLCTECDRAPH